MKEMDSKDSMRSVSMDMGRGTPLLDHGHIRAEGELKGSFCDDCPIASAQLWFQDQSSVLLSEKFVSGLDESIHVMLSNLIQQLTDTHVAPRLVMARHATSDGLSQF
jgi:hypothetical protein